MGKFEEAISRFAKYVIQQARSNLTKNRNNASKKLYNSLKYKTSKDKVTFEMEDYGIFQDQGVRGSTSYYADSTTANSPFKYKNKMPPSSAFDKWSIRKGIAPRDKEGKFINRKSLNYLLARGIFNKGIRATLFFTKPFEAGIIRFGDEIAEGYIDDNINIEE